MDNLIFDRTKPVWQNVADWNRIEQWIAYLAGQLHDCGYTVIVSTRTWTMTDFPNQSEIDRIRANIDALQTGFYSLPDWRDIMYNNTLDFNQCNAWEWDLQRINDWLSAMVSWANMRQAGTVFMQAGGFLNA